MMVRVFGIRHHGPGSARSLSRALEELQPDVILVEGPPDAQGLLPWLAHPDLQPPVALLIYVPDQPQRSVYYPFAVFSPEWQAMQYGMAHGLPVRFMDLAQAHQLLPVEEPEAAAESAEGGNGRALNGSPVRQIARPRLTWREAALPSDPISWLAATAGYSDSERWWEHQVEQRRDGRDLFAAILELMTALRAEFEQNGEQAGPEDGPMAQANAEAALLDARREAAMRQTLRAAQAEGFQRIAVVCGAWHAPALVDLPPASKDERLLKGLPKAKVAATWVPWTYGRLSASGGYGAGIESPGWYHHLWHCDQAGLSPTEVTVRWMAEVARLFRQEDLDASSAHVIEAVRLAEALAALRDRPLPGLPEMNEAVQAVFCLGEGTPLRLVRERLIVSERLGSVPEGIPAVALQEDLHRQQKRLRLSPDAAFRDLDLDLRKPTDLERSHLLHRLDLLGIPWGRPAQVRGKSGTFHELWRLQWQPEFAVAVIEASPWGNTVLDAAAAFAVYRADRAEDLATLTELAGKVLLADLPQVIGPLMTRLENEAALASDTGEMMGALPALAELLRYGNVRQTDTAMIARVVDGLVSRICIGLPLACASLNDEAAGQMFQRLIQTQQALALLQNDSYLAAWQSVLAGLVDRANLHGLLAGRCSRILLDSAYFSPEEAARRLSLALSRAVEPPQAAAWLEGFLKDSGALLVHDPALFGILDEWLVSLPNETFIELLPLLRRTSATFSTAERRMIGERVRTGTASAAQGAVAFGFDPQQAQAVTPVLRMIFGHDSSDT